MTDLFHNITGMLGVGCIILAYLLLQLDRIKSNQLSYSLINLTGALLVMVSLIRFWNLPSFVIEVFWVLISIWGIVKWIRHRS